MLKNEFAKPGVGIGTPRHTGILIWKFMQQSVKVIAIIRNQKIKTYTTQPLKNKCTL